VDQHRTRMNTKLGGLPFLLDAASLITASAPLMRAACTRPVARAAQSSSNSGTLMAVVVATTSRLAPKAVRKQQNTLAVVYCPNPACLIVVPRQLPSISMKGFRSKTQVPSANDDERGPKGDVII